MRGGDANGSAELMAALTQAAPLIDAVLGKRRGQRQGRPTRVPLQ
jgi:hypothetical protein